MPDAATNDGWELRRFGEMAIIVNDRVDDPAEAGVERYLGLEHLDSESLTIRRWGSPDDVHATKLRFRPGDIIFGRRRAYQRKLAVADFDGICSAHAMVLRARPEVVHPAYLPVMMQSDLFMERAVEISVGSLSPTINWKTLAQEQFLVPPLEEQSRILAAVQPCEAALESLRQAHSLLSMRVTPAIERQLVARARSTASRTRPLGALATFHNGFAFHPLTWRGSGLPIIRIQNLNGEPGFNYYQGEPDPRWTVTAGDLLFAWSGNRGTSFGPRIWTGPKGVLNQHIFRVSPKDGVVQEYLYLLLRVLTRHFEGRAHGSAGLVHVTRGEVETKEVPWPSVESQQDLVQQHRQLLNAEETLVRRLDQVRTLKGQLLNSTVARP